jgi:hypothetical protein
MAAKTIASRIKAGVQPPTSSSSDSGDDTHKRDDAHTSPRVQGKKSSDRKRRGRQSPATNPVTAEVSGRSRAKTEKKLLKKRTAGLVSRRTSGYESASDINNIVAKLNAPASFHAYQKTLPRKSGAVRSPSTGLGGFGSSGYFSESEQLDRPSSSTNNRRRTTRFSRGTLVRGGAYAAFECLKSAECAEEILSSIQSLWGVCEVRSLSASSCLSTVRQVLESVENDNYINMRLFDVLQSYLDQPQFAQQPCKGRKVLIVGAGPVGLRLAIELCALGAEVHVVEQRKDFSRLNVLKLWHWVVQDVGVALAGKIWDSGFATGKKVCV